MISLKERTLFGMIIFSLRTYQPKCNVLRSLHSGDTSPESYPELTVDHPLPHCLGGVWHWTACEARHPTRPPA